MWEVCYQGEPGISSVCTVMLGSGDPQMSKNRCSWPLPAKWCQCLILAMAPPWLNLSLDLSFFSTHSREYARSSPGQRYSTVQQMFIVHHSAMGTAVAAGDTGMDKMKCLPLGSSKLGAASDSSAVSAGMEVATQTQRVEIKIAWSDSIQWWWWQTIQYSILYVHYFL